MRQKIEIPLLSFASLEKKKLVLILSWKNPDLTKKRRGLVQILKSV